MKLALSVRDIVEVMLLVLHTDDETINNGTVTLRDRDTMEQITLKLDEVKNYINNKIKF